MRARDQSLLDKRFYLANLAKHIGVGHQFQRGNIDVAFAIGQQVRETGVDAVILGIVAGYYRFTIQPHHVSAAREFKQPGIGSDRDVPGLRALLA